MTETQTIQTWPSGRGYEYRGDPDGPAEQRRLRTTRTPANRGPRHWRKGNADEWREIVHSRRAERYSEIEILCCDSMLVDELIKVTACMPYQEGTKEFIAAWSQDEIRNLYPNPDDWGAAKCWDWLTEHSTSDAGDPCEDGAPCHFVPSGTRDVWHCTTHGYDEEPEAPKHCQGYQSDGDDDPENSYLDSMRQIVRDNAEAAEVYEWWRVSSWLCDQLHAIGEVTIDNGYGHWWGRTYTGQGYLMDGTLQQVAARFN